MKKLTFLLAVVAIFACFASVSVFADDTMETAIPINVNQYFEGSLGYPLGYDWEYDETDYFKFTIPAKGDVSLSGAWVCNETDDGTIWFDVYDAYGNYVGSAHDTYNEEGEEPLVLTLEPGTYYLEVHCVWESEYQLMINYVGDPNAVTVTIPTFPITINGVRKDNSYAKYPYIVYNDITYCPMTYYGASFLGLSANWTADTGLVIRRFAGGSTGYDDTSKQYDMNYGSYSAQKATGKISVNGKTINNSYEEYPLLVFRDVTYFPLTWRFAVEEFGWNYSFTNYGGLVINN